MPFTKETIDFKGLSKREINSKLDELNIPLRGGGYKNSDNHAWQATFYCGACSFFNTGL